MGHVDEAMVRALQVPDCLQHARGDGEDAVPADLDRMDRHFLLVCQFTSAAVAGSHSLPRSPMTAGQGHGGIELGPLDLLEQGAQLVARQVLRDPAVLAGRAYALREVRDGPLRVPRPT